jgi:uncharacterized membrane protein YidH (DUF202 family)
MTAYDRVLPRDPGLQAERTALAWNRTALAVLANALLILRSGWVTERTTITALGFVLLIAAAAFYWHGAWRRRELLSSHGAVAPRTVVMEATAIIALAVCAIGLVSTCITSSEVRWLAAAGLRPT